MGPSLELYGVGVDPTHRASAVRTGEREVDTRVFGVGERMAHRSSCGLGLIIILLEELDLNPPRRSLTQQLLDAGRTFVGR